MTIAISLSPEIEALLREKADRQGQDMSTVAAQMLTRILESETRDAQEAIQSIPLAEHVSLEPSIMDRITRC
ncbi:hypothetical protein [Microcoleus sp. bin38.metabat.b11b12b14.051]|uniref:hypothetical protein n=1 Tax=Microcoleus sp. bin38.metabat.b11b12b14.051 TaxID=2742709 RepID=UPI0025F1EE0E|nr:hypothetical protein [Microcoleus sp. bin38.metabat.b11b12b14.051]